MNIKALQKLVDEIRSGHMTVDELEPLVHHEAAVVRANAIEMLGCVGELEAPAATRILRAAVVDEANGVHMFGTITLAHVAVASLLRLGTPDAAQAAQQLMDQRPEPERSDLQWYLESEGLLTSTPAAS